ncbi:MAG: hypothetical protein C5S49_04160 [Candidatus Methanogaster sp.]|nr:MAG: hypothetical protein C5S49_04160 [ANME-2 cluster archaeon]
MKEQQQLNLNGRKEIGKLEMTKEVVYTLNGMGLLALFAFGFLFTSLYTLITGKIDINYTSGTILSSVALVIGTFVLHELIHGVFMSKYGGKPSSLWLWGLWLFMLFAPFSSTCRLIDLSDCIYVSNST